MITDQQRDNSLTELMVNESQPQGSMTTMEACSRAEIDVQIATARKWPRNLIMVKKQMMDTATLDIETAKGCFYSLPRSNKVIEGPSIRMAEIALSLYQHLRVGTRILDTVTSGEHPHVLVQAICHDLQNNVMISIEKRRRIFGKSKNAGRPDEDDINLATNACSAIALRDAVFKVVPLVLIKPAYEAARKVAVGDQKTLSSRRTSAIEAFQKMGIGKEQVFAKLEVDGIEAIGLGHLELLLGLYTAIKDGELNIDEAFGRGVKAGQPTGAAKAPAPAGPIPVTIPPIPTKKIAEPLPQEPAKAPEPPVEPSESGEPVEVPPAEADAPESNPEPSATDTEPVPPEPDPAQAAGMEEAMAEVKQIMELCGQAEITPDELHTYLKRVLIMKPKQTHVRELSGLKRRNIIAGWQDIVNNIRK